MSFPRLMAQFLITLPMASLLFSSYAKAEQTASCYRFVKSSTERTFPVVTKTETWCYQQVSNSKKTFVYNADEARVKPEMSFTVDENGIMTHASLLKGQLTIHTVRAREFNPFSIPFNEPKHMMPMINFKTLNVSSINVLNFLENSAAPEVHDFSLFNLDKFEVINGPLPWRGFWYPRKNMPMLGPLSKYDRFVQARTGVDPGSVAWENQNHAYHGVGWSGHCNGWAAATILRAEPVVAKTDPATGIVFSVSDQKGILTEADYCVGAAFFGNRNFGGGNNGDIKPELFHKTILYYIGNLHKPVAMDYHPDSSVDNHVASGYAMDIVPTGPKSFSVTTTLSMHGYDNAPSDIPGVARPYTTVYQYNLTTDDAGNPIGGNWLSKNPDFLWVPLSPVNCQKLDNTMISVITNL